MGILIETTHNKSHLLSNLSGTACTIVKTSAEKVQSMIPKYVLLRGP